MELPKVEFRKTEIDQNVSYIVWSFFEESDEFDYRGNTLKIVPELREVDTSKTREEQTSDVKKIATAVLKNLQGEFDREVLKYNGYWKPYNDKFFSALIDYLKMDWPKDKMTIYGNIGLLVTFPRFLKFFEFMISANVNQQLVVQSTAHECVHFLWFQKWKELYPDCDESEFESPNLVWLYSEMVIDPILNSPGLQEVLKFPVKGYDYFYEGEYLEIMEELRRIFSLDDKNIDDKIKEGYEYFSKTICKTKGGI